MKVARGGFVDGVEKAMLCVSRAFSFINEKDKAHTALSLAPPAPGSVSQLHN